MIDGEGETVSGGNSTAEKALRTRGTQVRIAGLQAKPELNGKVGSTTGVVTEAAVVRYGVKLPNGSTFSLKEANLEILTGEI